jgi:hypothetical protein
MVLIQWLWKQNRLERRTFEVEHLSRKNGGASGI